MIYTVTFNPALDYFMHVSDFELYKTNRSKAEFINPGGKGINVSFMLKNLGVDSTALGFAAGFSGEELVRLVKARGINCDFVMLKDGMTRINVKLESISGTEINAGGPAIDESSCNAFVEKLSGLKDGDILVIAGKKPNNYPDSLYADIMKDLKNKVEVVIDATGKTLEETLKYHPLMIKPNKEELEEFFGVKCKSDVDIVTYAKKLKDMGAKNVLVSLGKDGAVLIAEDGDVYKSNSPCGKLINAVGAGDSMVAGFIAAYSRGHSFRDILRMSIAAGSASAFSDSFGTRELVEELFNSLK